MHALPRHTGRSRDDLHATASILARHGLTCPLGEQGRRRSVRCWSRRLLFAHNPRMPDPLPTPGAPDGPSSATSLAIGGWKVDPDPPKVALTGAPEELQVLMAEHQGLLSTRSLLYNEAFTRSAMFFQLLGMSFLALAFVGPALQFNREFVIVALLTLAFDLVMGIFAFLRVGNANGDETRTVLAINRVRHGMARIAPGVVPFLENPPYDDFDTVVLNYGPQSPRFFGNVVYGLSTSAGTVGLVTALVAGLLCAVIAIVAGLPALVVIAIGAIGTVVALVLLVRWALRLVARHNAPMASRFPASRGLGDPPARD
jgi:hypothetical protein